MTTFLCYRREKFACNIRTFCFNFVCPGFEENNFAFLKFTVTFHFLYGILSVVTQIYTHSPTIRMSINIKVHLLLQHAGTKTELVGFVLSVMQCNY
jgi:hypothetical protein